MVTIHFLKKEQKISPDLSVNGLSKIKTRTKKNIVVECYRAISEIIYYFLNYLKK